MRNQQSGFTLVEIAIVLVIIGLLLGGVLKGQELITQAKIKNVANDFNGLTAAIYSYQDRYKRLPGDDPGQTRWTVAGAALTVAANQGDGNNQIAGVYESTTDTNESRKFWLNLRLAGFVERPHRYHRQWLSAANQCGGRHCWCTAGRTRTRGLGHLFRRPTGENCPVHRQPVRRWQRHYRQRARPSRKCCADARSRCRRCRQLRR